MEQLKGPQGPSRVTRPHFENSWPKMVSLSCPTIGTSWHLGLSLIMWPLILRAANRVKEEAVKSLDALIRNLTKILLLYSIGQKKSQGYPRVKRRGKRLHLLMGEVQRYGFFSNNLPWTATPFQNQVVVVGQIYLMLLTPLVTWWDI